MSKRATSAAAEGPAYGLDFARRCGEFPLLVWYSKSNVSLLKVNLMMVSNIIKEYTLTLFFAAAEVACGRFPKFHRVFLGRDPGTLKSDIVSKKTSTINLFGFETLKLKIRRLKLWKATVVAEVARWVPPAARRVPEVSPEVLSYMI